jgi:hypothetical protein
MDIVTCDMVLSNETAQEYSIDVDGATKATCERL